LKGTQLRFMKIFNCFVLNVNHTSIHFYLLFLVHGERFDRAVDRAIKGLQMAPPVKLLPRWETGLILDKESYPIKPGELNVCFHSKALNAN